MGETDIPQIKPDSILVPPQIRVVKDEIAKPIEPMDSNNVKIDDSPAIGSTKRMKFPTFKFSIANSGKVWKILLGILLFFVIAGLLVTFFIVLPVYSVYKDGMVLVDKARSAKDALSSQDIGIIESEINNLEAEFNTFHTSYNRVLWMKKIPYVGAYVADGEAALNAGTHAFKTAKIGIETIRPYADIIGLAATSGEDTANDRIEFLVQTIEDVLPHLDELSSEVAMIQGEVAKIDPYRYPEEFRGKEVRHQMIDAFELLDQGATLLNDSKPLLQSAPYLLGIDDTRKYLLIFQNDKELRPTGGFLTGYSIVEVSNGKFKPVRSSDIYDLDSNYTPSVEAPEVIRDYLKGPYLISDNYRLRDMNWNPDFEESMNLFTKEAADAGVDDIDGVIAVDTQVVVNLLDVLGEIGVSGYGNFSTNIDERCDCPQVIYELEAFADVEGPVVWNQDGSGEIIYAPENYGQRKEIIGPLMNSILANALGQPKNKLPDLFDAGFRSVTEKHVLLYLFDEDAQAGAVGANFAGKLNNFDGDYLHVNDANLGGRKSNLYVTHEVIQDISIAGDGTVTKTVTLNYANTQDYDGWLNSVLPNWTRVYVPQGSILVSSDGFDKEAETYDENGKTVFAGGFELRPNGVKKMTSTYTIPQKFDRNYQILIQKQPGTDKPLYTINLGKRPEEFFLKTDKVVSIRI